MNKSAIFYFLFVFALSACQTETVPFEPVITKTNTLEATVDQLIQPYVKGIDMETNTSNSVLTVSNKNIHQLTMTALFQLEQQQTATLYASLLAGMKTYLEEANCKVSGVVQTTGSGVASFNYAYLKGGTTGLLQVWGVAGEGETFRVFVSISEQ